MSRGRSRTIEEQTQLNKLRELMIDGVWRTDVEINMLIEMPIASVTAQLRHLRKPEHGSWEYLKRIRQYTERNEYQLLSGDHPQSVEMRKVRAEIHAATKATKRDFASWTIALRKLMHAVSVVNMEDAEGKPLTEADLPTLEMVDEMQSPVMVSREAMLEVHRLGWWLRHKTENM